MAFARAIGTMLYEQFFETPRWTPSSADLLTGRTVIVTGANVGLGFETSIKLAGLNPKRVILAVRNLDKGEKARTELVQRSGIAPERVEVWELDLARFDSVKTFAARVNKELNRLDIVCENAGLFFSKWRVTDDQWEEVLQVNGISTGLLGVLFLPLLSKTAALPLEAGQKQFKPHLTIVGSDAHSMYTAHKPVPSDTSLLADLNNEKSKNAGQRYDITKLLNLFLARKIAALPLAQGVVVNCVNPGLSATEVGRDLNPRLVAFMCKLARTAEVGARNLAWACENDTPPGAYISVSSVRKPSTYSRRKAGLELEDKLWAELVAEWTALERGVKRIVA